jgi:hypothetical protein
MTTIHKIFGKMYMNSQYRENNTTPNSTLAIGGVSSPLDSFAVTESSVPLTTFCAEKLAHRQSANR